MNPPEPVLQRLLEQAPYVRLLARQLVAEHADDVEQQTWLLAIQHGGKQVERPRAWLAQIVRNVAASVHRTRARQRPDPDPEAMATVPSSAELMQQEEQRRQLVAFVDRLPTQLRTVVLLRYFEGLPPRAIAQRLGLPTTTVWNQLRRALQLLRQRLDAEHDGDRRAWLMPLLPFARGPADAAAAASGTTALLGLGAMTMTMKTWFKVVAVAVLLVAAGTAVILCNGTDPAPVPRTMPSPQVATGETIGSNAPAAMDPVAASGQRQAAAPDPAIVVTTGVLVVRARHADDKSPAADVVIGVRPAGSDARTAGVRRRTDSDGEILFADLHAGAMEVTSDRSGSRQVEIVAGQTTELEFEFDAGLLLTGVVVDTVGVPVANAAIDVVSMVSGGDYETLAHSGPDGRFTVRDAPNVLLVGARAEGHRASALQVVQGRPGNGADVRLQLDGVGGGVEGLVVDLQGTPIAAAVVCIGSESPRGDPDANRETPRLPALVRSDEHGRFRAIGLAPGTQLVQARADGRAPWRGSCEITAHLTVVLRIVMDVGGSIRGTVVTAKGEPVAGAFVKAGNLMQFVSFVTKSAADGTFELSGLPAGELQLEAVHSRLGRVALAVVVPADSTTSCELCLSQGCVLRGRVVDASGEPITTAQIECHCDVPVGNFGWGLARTDEDGRFAVNNCPEGALLLVHVRAPGHEPLTRPGVDPTLGPTQWTLQPVPTASARMTGTIVTPDGRPLANATVTALRLGGGSSAGTITAPDGRFDFRELSPGEWGLSVRASGYPTLFSERRSLLANATWDMDTIIMVVGGIAEVGVAGDRAGVQFQFVGDNGRPRTDWRVADDTIRSAELLPGTYHLLVAGRTVAAQAIPFTIRSAEVTKIDVQLAAGTCQRFEFDTAALAELPPRLAVRIRQGTQLLRITAVVPQAGRAPLDEICLSPGDYTITVSTDDRELASATFAVGAIEAAPVRMLLR